MHAVIVGAGRIGRSLAGWLISAGQEVAVVDIDARRCAEVEAELGGIVIPGDGTRADVLHSAGAGRAGVLMATTGSAAVNMVACQMARHRFGVEGTVSLVGSDDHAGLFNLLGIDSVNMIELVSRRIQESLPIEGLVRLMNISGSTSSVMAAIRVPAGSSAVGTRLRDLAVPAGTVIPLVIARNGGAAIPREDTELSPDDQVVAVTAADELDRLRDLFGSGTGA